MINVVLSSGWETSSIGCYFPGCEASLWCCFPRMRTIQYRIIENCSSMMCFEFCSTLEMIATAKWLRFWLFISIERPLNYVFLKDYCTLRGSCVLFRVCHAASAQCEESTMGVIFRNRPSIQTISPISMSFVRKSLLLLLSSKFRTLSMTHMTTDIKCCMHCWLLA